MSKPPRIRYFAGPETWALARDAYLGGEAAASIARRLGLTVNGIRKRAARHGWTRTQHARALARERRPDQVLGEMLARIGPALREGRLEEAADLARAAERLTRVADAAERLLPPTPQEKADALAAETARRAADQARWERAVYERAEALADALLSAEGHGIGACWSHAAFHWRARVLGPKVAHADFARAVYGGWADRYYTPEGALEPLADPDLPDDLGRRQFMRNTGQLDAGKTLADFPWPPACAGAQGDAGAATQDAAVVRVGARVRTLD